MSATQMIGDTCKGGEGGRERKWMVQQERSKADIMIDTVAAGEAGNYLGLNKTPLNTYINAPH